MIYTDKEIRDWWRWIGATRQRELFETMIEKSPSEYFTSFSESLMDQWARGKELSPKQIAAIRKWDR